MSVTELQPPYVMCKCGGPAVVKKTQKPGENYGRRFYSCSIPRDDPSACNFFKWLDKPNNAGAPATKIPAPPTTYTIQKNQASTSSLDTEAILAKLDQIIVQQDIIATNLAALKTCIDIIN